MRDRARCADQTATETAEEREARLQATRDRRAAESSEARETRLQCMSSNQHERLASESAEARETRLQHVSSRQHERLASETSRERDARLRSVKEGRERQSQPSLFEQQAVRAKMQTFHAQLATLDAPRCSTCAESFPGLQLRPPSTECVRCSRDKHSPKLYSFSNNMDPGPIPPEL